MRIETGAVQFEGDWPGVFIRGDNAMGMWIALQRLALDDTQIPRAEKAQLRKLLGILKSCDAHEQDCNPLKLKSAEERLEAL